MRYSESISRLNLFTDNLSVVLPIYIYSYQKISHSPITLQNIPLLAFSNIIHLYQCNILKATLTDNVECIDRHEQESKVVLPVYCVPIALKLKVLYISEVKEPLPVHEGSSAKPGKYQSDFCESHAPCKTIQTSLTDGNQNIVRKTELLTSNYKFDITS